MPRFDLFEGDRHDKNSDKTETPIESEDLPALPRPPHITSEMAKAYLNACGGHLSTYDHNVYTFTVEEKTYTDTSLSLLGRVSFAVFKSRGAKTQAGIYLKALAEGKTHEQAKQQANGEVARKLPAIPSPPNITKEVALAIFRIFGEDLNTFNQERKVITVGKNKYEDSPRLILERTSKTIWGGTNISFIMRYFQLLSKGKTHEQARKLAEVDEASSAIPFPNPPDLTPEMAKAFIDACGGKLSGRDATQMQITVGGKLYKDSLISLMNRIARNVFNVDNAKSLAQSYLRNIASGKTHQEAIQLAKKEKESRLPKIPAPPYLTGQMAKQIIDACGGELNSEDNEKRVLTVDGRIYEDTVANFLLRLSRKVFGMECAIKLSIAYAKFLAEGKKHEEAKRLAELGAEGVEDNEFEKLGKLEVEDAIALFGRRDPTKLRFYLYYAYPELSEEEIEQLVRRSFRGLITGPNQTKEEQYLKWDIELPEIEIETDIPESTKENVITIKGRAPNAECIYVAGTWNRRKKAAEDGTFEIVIPLEIGEENEIRIMALDREKKVRSEQESWIVKQEGTPDDLAALIKLLSQLRGDLLSNIQKDPGRTEFFISCAQKLLIKKFARSFPEGEEYMRTLIEQTRSKVVRRVLEQVLKNFRVIDKMKLPNVKDGSLMFFQKYCVYEIRKQMQSGAKGINLANDPGLGKTRTILATLSDEEAVIFTPNAVVSTWDEEATAALTEPDLLVLRDIPHQKRKEFLRGASHLRIVTNIQFLRNPEDTERFNLLSTDNTVVVHDEAHSRANEQSMQSRGAKKLRHKFQINVTATLANNSRMLRRMLHTLDPNDKRFKDDKAFAKAFPSNDPQALKTLKLLVDRYTIRFRKEDVMEEVDPDILLSQQLHRLPRKNVIPPEQIGEFEMSEDQAWAIYQMFVNWNEWTETYGHYMPDDEIAEEDRLRVSGTGLVKKHALRQTVNNPSYIGSEAEDSKAKQTRRIVEKCMREGRKVVIFCAYTAQALKYAEMFKKHNPALYTGLTSKEGGKKGTDGLPKKFKREPGVHGFKGKWVFDRNGYPVEDPKGEAMSALDYERLTFQNAPDRRLIICTEKAGAVGTTFTAGKALIDDDLSDGVIMDIQKKDRIHRIDPQRLTHPTADYYTLRSRYPKKFLEETKKLWLVKQEDGTYEEYKSLAEARRDDCATEERPPRTAFELFFVQGTYDQVQSHNLEVQRQMFRLINDGIADDSVLKEDQMPFAGLENGNGDH